VGIEAAQAMNGSGDIDETIHTIILEGRERK
jgi:hypothetical protein